MDEREPAFTGANPRRQQHFSHARNRALLQLRARAAVVVVVVVVETEFQKSTLVVPRQSTKRLFIVETLKCQYLIPFDSVI